MSRQASENYTNLRDVDMHSSLSHLKASSSPIRGANVLCKFSAALFVVDVNTEAMNDASIGDGEWHQAVVASSAMAASTVAVVRS